MLTYLIIIGIFALAMRLLMFGKLNNSSLLYIFIPYCISVAITLFRSYEEPSSQIRRFVSHVLTALSILFSTSILIGEGFICIAFFAPIYLTVVIIVYVFRFIIPDNNKYAFILPVIVIAMSLEGTSSPLSFERDSFVEVSKTTDLNVAQLKANLAKPFDLNKERHWLISIFPMPYHIDAGSLNAGDVHTVYTRYHRWFVTNTHEGQAELLIEKVEPNKITTRVISDTTYFTNYLQGTGTEIYLVQNSEGGTDITLRLNYQRKLDPAWYFHPLQKFGVSKMGELIINELLIRS